MTRLLALLAAAAREMMLGENPPPDLATLREVVLAAAPAAHRGVVECTAAMTEHFEALTAAVWAGKKYSETMAPEARAKVHPDVVRQWDAATVRPA